MIDALIRKPSPDSSPATPEQLLAQYTCCPEAEDGLRELHALVTSARPEAPLSERMAWLEELSRWLRTRGALPSRRGRLAPVKSSGSARLHLLLEVLDQAPERRNAVRELMRSVLAETSALSLFTEPGLSAGRGLLGDAVARLGQRFLPAPPDERDLAQLVWRLFPSEEAAAWLEQLSGEHVAELCAFLGAPALAPLEASVKDAVVVLSLRASALGLSSDVLAHLPPSPMEESPFVLLPLVCEALVAEVLASPGSVRVEEKRDACAEIIAGCRAAAQAVLRHMHAHAVNTGVVYRLEQLGQLLDRLEALLWMLAPDRPDARTRAGTRLLSSLVRAHAQERSVARLFRGSVRYISRRIFEHTGHAGHHYIATDEDQYHKLVSAAAGGGLITAGTAILKLLIAFAALPLFFEGLAAATNYAFSFMMIQLLGFTLATKQPSMTGAALAASMDVEAGDKGMRGLVKQLACITRSQLASVFGNLGAVVAVSTVVGVGYKLLHGHPVLNAHEAEHVVHSLNPLKSGTILFAAFTGVLLWCSSVVGGWMENWANYRRLKESLARHPGLIRLMGEARAKWLGEFLTKNACGLGANISLGVLLGMTPAVCRFFGLPLDVRHVTLSSGTLAFAGASLGVEQLVEPDFLWAVAGIGVVAVINLSVSFSLGLIAAMRARGLGPVGFARMTQVVLSGGIRSLLDFVVPPRTLLPAAEPSAPYAVRSAARARNAARGYRGDDH